MSPVYVIGDVHGHLKKLTRLLHDIQLVDEHLTWQGHQAVLWFIGDLVDRGPDSIAVLDLVMRLQQEATAIGGMVGCLLGNHEMLMLSAYHFGRRSTGLSSSFITRWRNNGGEKKDLAKLTSAHLDWLKKLPAMARVGQHTLLHADAAFYLQFGSSVTAVNTKIATLLQHSDTLAWEELLEDFARRGAFAGSAGIGDAFARRFLETYGGSQLVHGHTPISAFTRQKPKDIHTPMTYAGGQCINVDGGMFLGGPGFIFTLS
jgi:hypothetical protein